MASIYVGNLPYEITEQELAELFTTYGPVQSAKLIIDHQSGRPRGFGFVEMENRDSIRDAISALNGNELGGRTLRVNEAHQRPGGHT